MKTLSCSSPPPQLCLFIPEEYYKTQQNGQTANALKALGINKCVVARRKRGLVTKLVIEKIDQQIIKNS